jgi:hypothetical protein
MPSRGVSDGPCNRTTVHPTNPANQTANLDHGHAS